MGDIDSHSASAYVDIDKHGRRFLYCSVCSAYGKPVFEMLDHGDVDALSTLGPSVKMMDKAHIEMEDLIPAVGSTFPHTIIVKSPMGTGKTTALKKLTKSEGLSRLMDKLGVTNFVQEQLQFLVVAPRVLVTTFLSKQLGAQHYQTAYPMNRGSKRLKTGQTSRDAASQLERWSNCSLALKELKRLAICIHSIDRLEGRDPYHVMIVDEATQSGADMVGELGVTNLLDTVKVYTDTFQKAPLRILLCADMDAATARVMAPDVDFNDPRQVTIIDNKGGEGGIRNVTPYISKDLTVTIAHLLGLIRAGHKVYVPCNQTSFMDVLCPLIEKELKASGGGKMLRVDSSTPLDVKTKLVDNTRQYLEDNNIQVLVASPTFGIGFSVDNGIYLFYVGYLEYTVAFMFTYPTTARANVQHMARLREPKGLIVYAEHRTATSKCNMFVREVARTIQEKKAMALLNIQTIMDTVDVQQRLWQSYAAIKESEDILSRMRGHQLLRELLEKATCKPCDVIESFCRQQGVELDFESLETSIATAVKSYLKTKHSKGIDVKKAVSTFTTEQVVEMSNSTSPADIKTVKLMESLPFQANKLFPNEMSETFTKHINRLEVLLVCYMKRDTSKILEQSLNTSKLSYEKTFGIHPMAEYFDSMNTVISVLNRFLPGQSNPVVYLMDCLLSEAVIQICTLNWYPLRCRKLVERPGTPNPKSDHPLLEKLYETPHTHSKLKKVLTMSLKSVGLPIKVGISPKLDLDVDTEDCITIEHVPATTKTVTTTRCIELAMISLCIQHGHAMIITMATGTLLEKYVPTDVTVTAYRGSKSIQEHFWSASIVE